VAAAGGGRERAANGRGLMSGLGLQLAVLREVDAQVFIVINSCFDKHVSLDAV
jgi:hypothetical protein